MKFQKELNFILKEIETVAIKFARNKPKSIKGKTKFDFVTEIDFSIEKYLTKRISECFPDDIVYGEEFHKNDFAGERVWTIDPIDGTFNLTRNIPLYGIQCSLIVNKKIVLGVIYIPWLKELVYAVDGEGCFWNGKRVQPTDIALDETAISFGDYSHKSDKYAIRQHKCIGEILFKIAKIRMWGSAAIDAAFVATKRTGATVIMTQNIWDLAPGAIIGKEAYGIVTNVNGKPYKIGDYGLVIANNKQLHKLIMSNLK